MKYQVGDKVKIAEKRTFAMNDAGLMDKYLGAIMTIQYKGVGHYCMIEDDGEWAWDDSMIICKIEDEKKELTNSELWKLAEEGKVKDQDIFECINSLDKYQIQYVEDEFYDAYDFNQNAVFTTADRWIYINPKPKMTKEEAEDKFGIIIVE